MLTDSHAHLTNPSLNEELDALLRKAKMERICTIINICTDPEELKKGLALSSLNNSEYPKIYNAASTTPHDAEKEGELYFETFAEYARQNTLIAIGETGLDYYYYSETKEIQKKILRKYLELAKDLSLPVVIHCRDAFQDFFQILDEVKHEKGVLHCFTGSLDEAKEVVKRGWYISLSGIVTYKKSTELREIAKWIPIERLLIETDAPYLAPQAYRGKRNEPAYLVETAKCLAACRDLSLEALSAITSENAKSLFNL